MTQQQTQVLIAGAGPTGLVLALWLTKLGIRVRIIDKSEKAGETSRAMVVHARILEWYAQIGIANEIIAAGIEIEKLEMKEAGKLIASLCFGDFGKGLSPYPFVLGFPQDDHEHLLIKQLQLLGVSVERETELVSLEQKDTHVRAVLRKNNSDEICEATYLCGCDGARSETRHLLNLDFEGGTYQQIFYVTDVTIEEKIPLEKLTVCLSKNDFTLVLPVRSSGALRFIGTVPPEYEHSEQIEFKDVEPAILRNTGLHVNKVNWFSTYHSHHRLSPHFRQNRVFLLGDAAHIHSPAGGQGMNTGIGDAVNLSWKLASVLTNQTSEQILDSYETERRAFALVLLATTDRFFRYISNRSWLGVLMRTKIMPWWLSFGFRFNFIRLLMFKTISQIRVNCRSSFLSEGKAGALQGGDRLPWVDGANGGNFAVLTSLSWQIHVYGVATDALKITARECNLLLHEFDWSDVTKKAGLEQNAMYLIRPDGYIGLVNSEQDTTKLKNYFSSLGKGIAYTSN